MSCCTGECCGPGSWCCQNAGPHDHDPSGEIPGFADIPVVESRLVPPGEAFLFNADTFLRDYYQPMVTERIECSNAIFLAMGPPARPLTRRQRLARWVRNHRPRLHLGDCP